MNIKYNRTSPLKMNKAIYHLIPAVGFSKNCFGLKNIIKIIRPVLATLSVNGLKRISARKRSVIPQRLPYLWPHYPVK